ncbi:hypothetical protein ACHQM5_027230 [Ranunculus cassubicifolius]
MVIDTDTSINESDNSRAKELRDFDDTKTGVKGLVNSGILKVPQIFIRPNEADQKSHSGLTNLHIPIIDLQGVEDDEQLRQEVVRKILSASESWGFFQLVNHGIPSSVMEGMINGVLRFNNEDDEVKKELYSRDPMRRVRFYSNFDLYTSKAANWRDTLTFRMLALDPDLPEEDELPMICRESTIGYTKYVTKLGDTLFELLSEGLGLKQFFLKKIGCAESCTLVCNYYPVCPEPDRTIGAATHTDPVFLTILLQNDIGGLQVLHQDQWVDIHPIPGALVINIGDLLQITSNGKLKSIKHRALVNSIEPMVSVACFLSTEFDVANKSFGPIKELITDDSPSIYRDILFKEYMDHLRYEGLDGISGLDSFRL